MKEIGVVAYPNSDGLMVRLGEEFNAVETLKKVFKDYVCSLQRLNKLPELDLDIALTVKFDPANNVIVEGSTS